MFRLPRSFTAGFRRLRHRRRSPIGLLSLIGAVLCLCAPPAAAGSVTHAYTLTDVGTFGGPNAVLNGLAVQITSAGAVLGTADTSVPDDDFPSFNPFIVGHPDPWLAHAFSWHHGKLVDLGALPGNNSSAVFEINRRGIGAGISETGTLDPVAGYPAEHAVLFTHGTVIDLGTLPGGHESQAVAINDRGQVAGFANNGIDDPTAIFREWGTQTRAFISTHGVMHDLGTLGGPDADLATLNAHGQAAGDSYTNATPNPTTEVPTTHPYLWTRGSMRDLGTLGGTSTVTTWLNRHGQVAGQSTLAGDQAAHPFLWDGKRLRDLGTLGGDFGFSWNLSDRGHVVGWATTTDNATAHAFLWTHGAMTDLTGAASTQCTSASWVNDHDQIVGETCDGSDALLWTDDRQYDLNTLIAPTGAHLTEAAFINDQGEITALGILPDGDQHVFLLRPTGTLPAAASTRHASVKNDRVRPTLTIGCGAVHPRASRASAMNPCSSVPRDQSR